MWVSLHIQPIPLEVTFSNAISFEGLFSCKQVSFHICGSLYTYSQSHLRWHFRTLFQSSQLKVRTSLFTETWQKRRSSFELWAFENVIPSGIVCTCTDNVNAICYPYIHVMQMSKWLFAVCCSVLQCVAVCCSVYLLSCKWANGSFMSWRGSRHAYTNEPFAVVYPYIPDIAHSSSWHGSCKWLIYVMSRFMSYMNEWAICSPPKNGEIYISCIH